MIVNYNQTKQAHLPNGFIHTLEYLVVTQFIHVIYFDRLKYNSLFENGIVEKNILLFHSHL